MTTKSLDEKLKKLNKQHPQLKRENVNNEEPQRKMKKDDKEEPRRKRQEGIQRVAPVQRT